MKPILRFTAIVISILISKYLKNFAKIYRFVMKNGRIPTNLLRNLELKYEQVRKEFLTQDELDAHGLQYDSIVSISELQGIKIAR